VFHPPGWMGRQRRSDSRLLDNQLVDEVTLLVCPAVIGQGTRLFPDTGSDQAFELVCGPPQRGSRSRSTGPHAVRSTKRPRQTRARDGGSALEARLAPIHINYTRWCPRRSDTRSSCRS
jgi:hypothetical protein